MGPNGSGKSTLANAIMGHPGFEVTDGQIIFNGQDITVAAPDERARMGLFMAFQYPVSVPGVTVTKYLRTVLNAHREAHGQEPISLKDFRQTVEAAMKLTDVPRAFSSRYLNEGFSGGEKKRMEILQLALQQPELAILDETDSGLDIDALRVVANGVNAVAGPEMGVLIITHYQRILHLVQPSHVHVMYQGRIVREGGAHLIGERRRRARDGRADHPPLPSHPAPRAAESRARHVPGPARQGTRPPSGRRARGQGLWLDHRRARKGAGVVSTVEVLRDVASEFPVLGREIDGHPIVYLDSAATSQTPQPVIDAMVRYYTETRASVHRGVYPLAVQATDLFEGARRRIADWLHSSIEETIFTANATAAINLVAYTWGRQNVSAGDLVLLTEMEHHSNIVPWQLLCQEREAELAYVPVLDDGQLDLAALDQLLARGPKLLAVTHVSNVLGTINPIAAIVARAHDAGAVVLVDGSL